MTWLPVVRMTLAERLRQPVTWLVTGVSLALLGVSFIFGQFNFELQDRLRMLAAAGVAVAIINGLFLAVLGASQTVHDELASRTALTLFAKPLSRGSYLVGKALAIWLSMALSSVVVMAAHLGLLAFALHHGFDIGDAHHHHDDGDLADLWVPWGAVVSAHALSVAHGAVLASLATVLALRLPLVANILVCFAIFVGGNLIASAGVMGLGPMPCLALFNLDEAIQFADHPIPAGYLGMTGLYTALYCAGCLFAGLAFFRRQDIL